MDRPLTWYRLTGEARANDGLPRWIALAGFCLYLVQAVYYVPFFAHLD